MISSAFLRVFCASVAINVCSNILFTNPDTVMPDLAREQEHRNRLLLERSPSMRDRVVSQVLPVHIDIRTHETLSDAEVTLLEALQIGTARTAIRSLASLATINEVDHLGGGLDLIPALLLTLSLVDYERREFTIEHAHTSIGYYAALASLGFLDETLVVEQFRRGLDIPGHVSWVPGGTQLNGGRLGVMIPAAVGQALGKRAGYGDGAWVINHCGDAGWISGQALNGFNGASLHKAPVTFVMHRNGVQLSGATSSIMDRDPRPVIESLGITILETPSLHDTEELYKVYREAYMLAQVGRPSLIYPVGIQETLAAFADRYGIADYVEQMAAKHSIDPETEVWIPGSLMSFRDVLPMLETILLVNGLPGGVGHHDGHMKGRNAGEVLANPMLTLSDGHRQALDTIRSAPTAEVVTEARPATGSRNLVLPDTMVRDIDLPKPGKAVSPRAGVEAAYAAVARMFPDHMFVVSCDLDPSTKLAKARTFLDEEHQFEMSIEEQASALMANGLAMSTRRPQFTVFSTFAAFFEGIAREGFEIWRYQRNLTGVNEGLNVMMHLSHVGACTGRDHFSGWGLDWITLAIGYLPYLHRFYAPADARAAFLAIRDAAAHYGGHIIGVPRDNLPVLTKQGSDNPLWETTDAWEAMTPFRTYDGAAKAILAIGAPVYLAEEAADRLADGTPTDVYIINGLPLPEGALQQLFERYRGGLVTIEDGIIGTRQTGLRGFAGFVAGAAYASGVPLGHIGITDPRIAPSEGHHEVWEHFGITTEALVAAVQAL